MNWLHAALGAAAVLLIVNAMKTWKRASRRAVKSRASAPIKAPETETPAKEAGAVPASEDLASMVEALSEPVEPLARHRLLAAIVERAYREREDPQKRAILHRHGALLVEASAALGAALAADPEARAQSGLAFKFLSMTLDEEDRWQEAVETCRKALKLRLEDGTKTGFEGRIVRIEKRRKKPSR